MSCVLCVEIYSSGVALPSSYLTSTKNLSDIVQAIQAAQAPDTFTQKFLEDLGFKSTTDRLVIKMLKVLGLLTDTGTPTSMYYEFLDQTQSGKVLARGMRTAYSDLFQLKAKAHEMSATELKNKMKTLTQGQASADVLAKMVTTFQAFAKLADFSEPATPADDEAVEESGPDDGVEAEQPDREGLRLGGLVYAINLELPESRDQAVYDALFRSLKEHLLT